MQELNPIQFKILNSLYFEESFQTLIDEVGGMSAVIADELKQLIDRRLVQVLESTNSGFRKSIMYDTDDMHAYYYQATSAGMDLHNRIKVENRKQQGA